MKRAIERTVSSYEELGKELGVSRHALHSWRTERRDPRSENFQRMADLLVDRSAEQRELAMELREEARSRRKRSA